MVEAVINGHEIKHTEIRKDVDYIHQGGGNFFRFRIENDIGEK